MMMPLLLRITPNVELEISKQRIVACTGLALATFRFGLSLPIWRNPLVAHFVITYINSDKDVYAEIEKCVEVCCNRIM